LGIASRQRWREGQNKGSRRTGLVGRAVDEIKELCESREGGVGPLHRQRESIQPQRSTIKGLNLLDRQVGQVLANIGEELISLGNGARIDALGRVDLLVVPDEELIGSGERDVQLDGRDARLESFGEGGKSGLDCLTARAAVSFQVEVLGVFPSLRRRGSA